MKAEYLTNLVSMTTLSSLQIRRGRIVGISNQGEIYAESDPEKIAISCSFLRTSAAPKPLMRSGDLVLFILDESRAIGYILGIIENSLADDSMNERTAIEPTTHPQACLKLAAKEKIELVCGKSMLSMDMEGKITIRGETITSRSRGTHKIRGGSVQIN